PWMDGHGHQLQEEKAIIAKTMNAISSQIKEIGDGD
ncbi:unnamed protein product, partial [marine sediment metagenome]